MFSWNDVEAEFPEFAGRVRAVFAAGTNKTIATLRADGSPRISGTELEFAEGEVTLGMMGGSMKLRDVRRDPRVAIHSPTLEPPKEDEWAGDAKLAGRLVEIKPPEGNEQEGAGFFKLDLTEVALTYLNDARDALVIESWHPDRGHRRRTRT
ncbi:pyridoxamine 5'-phosphate oxidase family protein [Actinophytocola xanthii]|uniref:Pyridoxamine 5-phosphate oxidase n=1 Tax=Actinophytocola xanthii TaxID=1912961 RepID=A0A1Q8C698_9PSEU|nr:pyridoxamine 5'-phosphate oxidase family protein [Actinophytocola xanthii]OLF09886.1 pyridoxamine 5-phosphate oxidase [Actinophytocola xanthii]